MDEVFSLYGQAVMAGISCIVLFGLTAFMFVNGVFAQYIDAVLNTLFG